MYIFFFIFNVFLFKRFTFSFFLLSVMKSGRLCCMMLLCGEIYTKMRKGGSMRLKKVHSTFLTAALACSLAVTPVFANPAEDAENLKNQKTEAESELSNLQTQFDTLIQKANELELKLIKTGEAIIQAQADLEAAEEKKEEQYEAMKKRIKFMYESGTGSATVEKVMTSGDMSSMLTVSYTHLTLPTILLV